MPWVNGVMMGVMPWVNGGIMMAFRRKGSQPVQKAIGPDGRPVLLEEWEPGQLPRAKVRDPEKQQYEMVENSPNSVSVRLL